MTIDEALTIIKEAFHFYYVEMGNGEAKLEEDKESIEAVKVVEEHIRKQDEILEIFKNHAHVDEDTPRDSPMCCFGGIAFEDLDDEEYDKVLDFLGVEKDFVALNDEDCEEKSNGI